MEVVTEACFIALFPWNILEINERHYKTNYERYYFIDFDR